MKEKEYIYTSPDGGHTVYQNEIGKPDEKELVTKDTWAFASEEARKDDGYCCTPQSVILRDKNPALKEAWEKYKTLWELSITDKDYEEAMSHSFTESSIE